MIGAIIGDVVGSIYEFHNIKTKAFKLFDDKCFPTDDSVMTLAVARSLLDANGDKGALKGITISNMQMFGERYYDAGYGEHFANWLRCYDPEPYNSYGNGSAMRVSPVAYVAKSLDEALELSDIVTGVTHNHPEGMKGARAVTECIYLALHGESKDDIRQAVTEKYYNLDFTLDEIRDTYEFHVDCMESVPQAIEAFLEGDSFEDVIRLAVSIGGDSDTIAAIAGSIAEPYYSVPATIRGKAISYLDENMSEVLHEFESKYGRFIDFSSCTDFDMY